MESSRRSLLAFTLPFLAFLAFLGLGQLIAWIFRSSDLLLLAQPKYWIYPLQTVACGGLLVFFWGHYRLAPLGKWPVGIAAGLVALALWVCPQELFGQPARTEGFNPEVFAGMPLLYWLNVVSRFARLVIVIPLLEEIFWRGCAMRYLINEDFTSVPFGAFRPMPFLAVAVLFMLEHQTPDWPAAFATGLIYNGVAVRTKSLFACVTAHAVTNLGLGLYIMATRQWGFW